MTRRGERYYEKSLWCFTDRLSFSAGEAVPLRVSNPGGLLTCKITRIGGADAVVFEQNSLIAQGQAFSPTAYRDGCRWPVAFEIRTARDWPSGYYRLQLSDGQNLGEHFFVIRSAREQRRSIAIILATNSYHAYNSWGGKCLYGTDVPVSIDPLLDTDADRTPVVATGRPFSTVEIAAPRPVRIPYMTRRLHAEGAGAPQALQDLAPDVDFALWDLAAGYLNKWEHAFVRWAENAGYRLDFLTQEDLERDAMSLDGYACALSVGHDEYWSWRGRDAVEAFIENGGNAAFFSGNAAYWQVRFDRDLRQMTCRKYTAHLDDPVIGGPEERFMTGMWSDPVIGRPETTMKGSTFTRGGYSRVGLCMGARPAGYTVFREDHWSLDGTHLFYGDMFGDAVAAAGYELDGCDLTFVDGLPVPTGTDGADPRMEIIALAPASLGESETTDLRKGLGHKDASFVAERIFGADTLANRNRARRGFGVVASFRKGRGEVFSAGGTEWAWGLHAADAAIERITRNVLDRFSTRR